MDVAARGVVLRHVDLDDPLALLDARFRLVALLIVWTSGVEGRLHLHSVDYAADSGGEVGIGVIEDE